MDQETILQELTTIFHQVLDDECIVLTPTTTADSIEAWDSFNHVNLIVATEAHFKIKFKTAEVEELKDVGDFVKAIAHKLAQKNA